MDYKKIIIYALVIIIAVGVWYNDRRIEERQEGRVERFARVYAGTMVMAELYRNEPDGFFDARDSIMAEHNVDTAWINQFRQSFEGHEEEWALIFVRIQNIADSLIDYYKQNPVEHDTTGVVDSVPRSDSL